MIANVPREPSLKLSDKVTFSQSWEAASRTERIAFAAVAVASVVSLFFSIAGYPAVGHDSDVHLNWLEQFSRLFHQGLFYPRWFNDSNGGFGSPTFYFYPPLPYWIASFVRSLLPFVPSPFFNLIMLIATLGSILTSRALFKQYSSNDLAIWTATLAYSFIAYRFADIFIRDALGEHWAMMFLPLVFLRRKDSVQQIAVYAIAWTGLLLCNIPTAILVAITLCLWIIIERDYEILKHHLYGGLVAVLVSAVYLLPSMMLRKYIHAEHLYDIVFATSGFALLDLFQHRGWLRFLSSITLVAGLISAFRGRNARNTWWWITVFCVVIQLPFYAPFWHPQSAPFVQFTWRWNMILMLTVPLLNLRNRETWMQYTMIALSVVTLFCAVRISNEFVLHRTLAFNRYRIDAPEYHPVWIPNDLAEVKAIAQIRIDDAPETLLGLTAPQDRVQLRSRGTASEEFDVALSQPSAVKFHLFYWPYWKLTRNEEPIPLQPDPNGFARATLPAGHYNLTLTLVQSRAEIYGKYISLFGLLCLIGITCAAAYREITMRFDATSEPHTTRKV
jgi:hypothetical protein